MEKQKNGLVVFYEKNVVVKFLNPEFSGDFRDGSEIITTTGTLTDFNDGDEDNEGFIVITNPTDYDRIPLKNVRKIFLKEDGK